VSPAPDAIVVGSGPNGLAAAIHLARAGRSVTVLEAQDTVGGAARSAELTLPGFISDFGSAILPLGAASPFFRTLPLAENGVEWIHPDFPLAHPLDNGTAAVLHRSVAVTAKGLGRDGRAYRRLMDPFVRDWDALSGDILSLPRIPRSPLTFARYGFYAVHSAVGLGRFLFHGEPARALFAGLGAHSFLPIDRRPSAAFGLMLGMLGHGVGWPFPRGGTQCFTDALVRYLQSLGAEIVTDRPVLSCSDLPATQATLFDVTPRQLLAIAGDRLPAYYRAQLSRYRYGPGVFKIDYALDGPVPWAAEPCRRAGTVHVGGTMDEIARGEREVWAGKPPERPFVLVAQQSLFDPSRAPAGKHTLWAYCHVPNGSTFDMTDRIEAQIERFAPGFKDLILARHVMLPADLERRDANLVGGDINGGIQDFRQLFMRPALSLVPYATPHRSIYLCSSSTPPGGGVHGMSGYLAAQAALSRSFPH